MSSAKTVAAEPAQSAFIAAFLIAVGVLATTLSQTQLLSHIPLQNLLKNELHVDRSANAAFFFWLTMPWYFKPLVGLVSDAFPLFGSRRRSYLIVGGVLSTLAWIGWAVTPHSYQAFVATGLIVNTFTMVASTAIGGYMVEAARVSGSSGRLTSVRNFIQQVSFVIAGPAGGLLANVSFVWSALASGGIAFLIVPAAMFLMREQFRHPEGIGVFRAAGQQLKTAVSARTMWATILIAAVFYGAPGLPTALFYKQQIDLHFTTQTQGFMILLNGITGVLAATLYGMFWAKRYTLRTLLLVCIVLGTLGNATYMAYNSLPQAYVIECCYGFGFTLAEVALMHLMVRSTPAGCEALGFALLVAVRNFFLFGGDWFGSHILERYHLTFATLVYLNAAVSILAAPLVLLLPSAIVDARDTDQGDPARDLTPALVHAEKE